MIPRHDPSRRTPHAPRTLASLAAAALVVAGLVGGTPSTAHADPATVDYSCDQTLLDLVPGLQNLPLSLDVLSDITVPLGGTIGEITDPLGLTSLLTDLSGAVSDLLGTVDGLVFTLGDTATTVTGTLTGDGALQLPSIPLPGGLGVGDVLPIEAPESFTITLVGGLAGTLTCTIDDVDQDVVAHVLVSSSDGGAGSTGGTGSTGGGNHSTSGSSATSTKKAAPATTKTTAKLKHKRIKHGKHGVVVITVKTKAGEAAHGKVYVKIDGHKQPKRKLSAKGKVSYKLKKLKRGTHHVKVYFVKATSFKASSSKKLTLKVT